MNVCKSVMDSHKLILIRAAAESPQWREMSLNWMRLLYKTALKECEFYNEKYKHKMHKINKCDRENLIAALTYRSFIPELFADMGENLYE